MLIHCTRCSSSLPVWVIKAGDAAMCPSCNSDLLIRVFPALLAARQSIDLQSLRAEEGESSCFFHPSKRAAETCRKCGRFICAICMVPFDGEPWCAPCLASAAANQDHGQLQNRRVLYDSIALGLTTLPVLLGVWPVLLSGPCGVFVSIFYWKRPTGISRPNKWRFVVAILLGLTETGLLIVFAIAMFIAVTRSGLRPR